MEDSSRLSSMLKNGFITAAITTLFAILMIFLGYYIRKELEAPKMKLEYVRIKPIHHPYKLDTYFVDRYIKSGLAFMINMKEKVLTNGMFIPYDNDCISLLGQGLVGYECVPDLIQKIKENKKVFLADPIKINRSNIESITQWDGKNFLKLENSQSAFLNGDSDYLEKIEKKVKESPELAKASLESENVRMQEELDKVNVLVELLEKYYKDGPERSGQVHISVGVQNYGDTDGVIHPEASISLPSGYEIALVKDIETFQEEYTVIKAHSFEKLEYVVNTGMTTQNSMNEWKTSLINKVPLEYKFNLRVPYGLESKGGKLPIQ